MILYIYMIFRFRTIIEEGAQLYLLSLYSTVLLVSSNISHSRGHGGLFAFLLTWSGKAKV